MLGFVRRLVELFAGDDSFAGRRHPKWEQLQNKIMIDRPACVVCGSTKTNRAVHHCIPFHLDPSKELDEANCHVVCHNDGCDGHLQIGHLGDYRAWNPDFVQDAKTLRDKRANRRYSL